MLILLFNTPVTLNDRIAAFNWCSPYDHVFPVPDGDIDLQDRAQIWGLFVASSAIPVLPGPFDPVVRLFGSFDTVVLFAGMFDSVMTTPGFFDIQALTWSSGGSFNTVFTTAGFFDTRLTIQGSQRKL